MNEYFVDEQGKWIKLSEKSKGLIEPSESYLVERELEEQQRLEEELFNSLYPSEKEILMAEIELNLINLLLEMGVF